MITQYNQQGIYSEKKRFLTLYTETLVKGENYFDEDIKVEKGKEYRKWDPRRSKLAAALLKKSKIKINKGANILYLGSSHGYTISYLSDIIGKEGWIYAVDPAPRVMQDFLRLTNKRNIIPILEDANHPEKYPKIEKTDILYMDVAQRNQVEIFTKHIKLLKKNGIGILMLKARSIDSGKKPKIIFQQVRKQLEKTFTLIDEKILDPFEKDHACFIVKVK